MDFLKIIEEKIDLPLSTLPHFNGKVARQWLPKPVRFLIRSLVLPFLWIDAAVQKIASWIVPPPYKRGGKCKRRGRCCVSILTSYPSHRLARGCFRFWNTQVNGFYEKEEIQAAGEKITVLGCRHLKQDGSCGAYFTRPGVCRHWPTVSYTGPQRLLKGCGYTATLRKRF